MSTSKKRTIAVVIAFSIPTAITADVSAVSYSSPTLSVAVDISTTIARVRIASVRPALFEFRGYSYSCGFIYQAELLKAYKGQVESFQFFSVNDAFFDSFDNEYLIFTLGPTLSETNRNISDKKTPVDLRDQFDNAKDNCVKKSQSQLQSIPTQYQHAYPIVSDLPRWLPDSEKVVESLKIVPGYPFPNLLSIEPVEKIFVMTDFEMDPNDEKDYILVDFEDVEAIILELSGEQ